jgi:hypothetical protein
MIPAVCWEHWKAALQGKSLPRPNPREIRDLQKLYKDVFSA